MPADVFPRRRRPPADRCEHCDRLVHRVWLVPGEVLNSCGPCFTSATGRPPVREQGFSSPPPARAPSGPPASFYLRADGRRPA